MGSQYFLKSLNLRKKFKEIKNNRTTMIQENAQYVLNL
jgi:hypothetical protein